MAKNLISSLILAHLVQIWPPSPTNTNLTLSQAIIVLNFNENLSSKLNKMAENFILGLI